MRDTSLLCLKYPIRVVQTQLINTLIWGFSFFSFKTLVRLLQDVCHVGKCLLCQSILNYRCSFKSAFGIQNVWRMLFPMSPLLLLDRSYFHLHVYMLPLWLNVIQWHLVRVHSYLEHRFCSYTPCLVMSFILFMQSFFTDPLHSVSTFLELGL